MTAAVKIAEWQEPIHGEKLILWSIPYMELEISPYQRKESTNLRNKLAASINIGFFSPLLVVRKEEKWLIIDGQHRKHAFMRAKGNFPMQCIEIPEKFMYYPLIFNIEKSDQIKDICVKVHAMYLDFVDNSGDKTERDLTEFLMDNPYYISLSFAHVEFELSSPSLVETSVKKFDDWAEGSLAETIYERRKRGELIANLAQTVEEVAERDGICGQAAFQLKKAIISKTNVGLWGRKRSIDETFDEAIAMMVDFILTKDWSFLAG